MIRRLITEDLSPTELLYDLCYEMEYYIDNTNTAHPITKRDLISIVGSVMEADLEEFRQNYKRPRERMVNRRYAERHEMTKRAVSRTSLRSSDAMCAYRCTCGQARASASGEEPG